MSTTYRCESNSSEHIVQFCETDAFLVNSVSEFIGQGLRDGEAAIVIATQPHSVSLEERLQADGLDLLAARSHGQYISLDIITALSQFMVDGLPEPQRFSTLLEGLLAGPARSQRRVRIFGEMVALLWLEGNHTAAIQLEELWNDLARIHPFSLFCAYPMQGFDGSLHELDFAEICKLHSHVIPAESYSTLVEPNQQLHAITLLQQQANSLKAEIAERKVVEERLHDSEARFRFMAESMPQKIFTAQPNGEIDYFNPQWTEFTGLAFDEIKGWGWTSFIHPDDVDENIRRWQHAVATGEPFYFEHRFRAADGAYRWHVSRAKPMRDDSGKIIMWIGSNTDIDEQKRLEERKDEFISMASHELKTPVTSLKGFTQVLLNRFKKRADDESLRFLTIMDTQLNRLTKLINELLDISKIQQGKLDYREESFNLEALVQEIVSNLQAATPGHQLLVESKTEAQVYADRDRIGQVLINLITNAVKYSPDADRVLIRVLIDQAHALISVQDFGIGIAKAYHQKIFERFYQVTTPKEKTYPGLGIGLYLANEIIKRHQGKMRVESTLGEGSTFSFCLPLAERLPDTSQAFQHAH